MITICLPAEATAGEAKVEKSFIDACAFGDGQVGRLTGNLLCLTAGYFVGGAIHEGSHQVVAWVNNTKLEWYGGDRWEAKSSIGGRVQYVAIAPFVVQSITTEALLDFKNAPRDHPLIAGLVAWDIINPIYYTVKSELNGEKGYRDLANFRRNDRRIIEAIFVGHSLISLYRLVSKDDKFRMVLTTTGDAFMATATMKW